MAAARRPCLACGRNRSEHFFTSVRGRTCADCRKKTRRVINHNNRIARTYGLSKQDHARLWEWQGGACAICAGKRTYNLCVDHDHATGKVRGLLCKRCNKVLAAMRDSPVWLRAAATYLEYPPATVLT